MRVTSTQVREVEAATADDARAIAEAEGPGPDAYVSETFDWEVVEVTRG